MTADDASGRGPRPSRRPNTSSQAEFVARLRTRAEQLRAGAPAAAPADPEELAGDAAPVAETDDIPDYVQPTGTLGGVEDPEGSELLRRWAEEDHLETLHPDRNWSPLIAVGVLLAVTIVVFAAFRIALSDDSTAASGPGGSDAEAGSVLDDPAPSLDDLTADVTVPPGPEIGLSVIDKGVTIVEDRFDSARREGTFAAIIENPNPAWLAQGVQVDVQFLDAAGAIVGSDNAFVELVLPSQKVAVASLFFDAPTVPVVDVTVAIDVARWRETAPPAGGFETKDVVTEPAEFSGVKTTFVLRSSFGDALTDVGVTAVYRNADGVIVGGYDTFLDRLDPEVDTPAEIALLANIPIAQIASTELYPTASFGFVPDQ